MKIVRKYSEPTAFVFYIMIPFSILWYRFRILPNIKICHFKWFRNHFQLFFVLTLAPSPNGSKEIPHNPRHLGAPSGASKTISEPMVCLAQTVHLSCTNTNNISNGPNEIPHDPRHLGVSSGASKMISDPMVHSAQTVHRSYVTISIIPNGPKWACSWASTPRSTIGCVLNDIWAYGSFGANRAPILH